MTSRRLIFAGRLVLDLEASNDRRQNRDSPTSDPIRCLEEDPGRPAPVPACSYQRPILVHPSWLRPASVHEDPLLIDARVSFASGTRPHSAAEGE